MDGRSDTDSLESEDAVWLMQGTQSPNPFTPQKVIQHSDSCSDGSEDTIGRLLAPRPTLQRQNAIRLSPEQTRRFGESIHGGSPASSDGSASCYHSCGPANTSGDCSDGQSKSQETLTPKSQTDDDKDPDSGHSSQASAVVVLPKKYDGKTCWSSYKLHYLNCAESNEWSDKESCRYLKTRLTGDAALVLAQAARGKWDLDSLMQALDTRFGVAAPDYVLKGRFRRIVQLEGQTLNDYADTLVRALTNKPDAETEAAERKALVEQFKYGIRSPHVKHYVCKRAPATIKDALKFANDCVAIENWIAETEFLRVWDQDKVNELCTENERLRQENLLLKNSPPPTLCYAAASADNSVATPTRETPPAVVATPPKMAPPKQRARPPSVATGSEDLFSEEEDDKPPDRVPPAQRPSNANRDSKVVTAPKRKTYAEAVIGEKRRPSKRAARPHPSQTAAKRKLDVALSDEESSVVEMGAATEADLKGGYSSDESLASEQSKRVQQTLARDYDPGESYYVWGELHVDVPAALFVIDTGAMVSMINKNVFDEIPLHSRPEVRQTTVDLKSVTTQEVKTYGVTTLVVNIQGKRLEHEFWICEMSESGVIGMDLLRAQKAMIDLAHDKLILGDKLIRVSNSSGQRVASKVVARAAVEIPPGREAIINARVYNKRTRGKKGFQSCALIEPARGMFHRTGAVVARVIVAANQPEVPVRVFNPSERPITIYKNTVLGKFTSPDAIKVHHSAQTESSADSVSQPRSAIVNQGGKTVRLTAKSNNGQPRNAKQNAGERKQPQQPNLTGGDAGRPPDNCDTRSAFGSKVPEHMQTLYDSSVEKLSEEHKPLVANLLTEYADVFAKSSTDVGKTHLVQHIIDTGNEKPIQERVRRFPYEQSKEIAKQVETMKEQGIIQESKSRWASNVVLVKKKDGTWRMCVDYRRLNMKTKNTDPYMLPRIDETLDRLSKAKYFSTLDLLSGYHQVELSPESKSKTAFIVPRMSPNHWEYKMMPFGLSGAPRTFQRLIDQLLRGLEYEIAMAYLDDIIVFSMTVEQMIARLKIVLQRLREAGLKLKAKKCALFQTETIYLGHVISADGVSCDPAKVQAVQNWLPPQTVKQVRAFLGTVGYYKRFIKGYADIARPLYQLTRKHPKFVWNERCQHAFEVLKGKLIIAPIMAYPQEEGDYILDTDASAYAIGAVLSQMQKQEDGSTAEKVIAYASRILHPRETRYCVRRREMLAIVHFVKYFRPYLWGRKVLIRTDHASLRYVKTMKEPSDQFHRWIERLEEVEYTIEVRQGVNHGNADGLSRMLCGGKNCICGPVQLLETRQGGDDDHEIVFAEARTDNEDTEQPLLSAGQAEELLQQKLAKRPRNRKKTRCVDFQRAQLGETDSEADTVVEATAPTAVSCDSDVCSEGKPDSANCKVGRHGRKSRPTRSQKNSSELCAEGKPGLCNERKSTQRKGGLKDHGPQKRASGNLKNKVEFVSSDEEELSDGITADAEDNDKFPAVRRVKTFTNSAATQTGDETHQLHDGEERECFVRAVQLGSLWTSAELIQAQKDDIDIGPLYAAKERDPEHKPTKLELLGNTSVGRFYFAQWDRLLLKDGVLCVQWESADCRHQRQRIVLPFKFRDVVMQHLHDSNYAGHLGERRTQSQVAARYYWYKLREDVARYIRTCDPCQRRKRPGKTPKAAMTTQNVGFRFERIAMDICGPMQVTSRNNKYVLVIGDYFSKFTMPIAIEDKTMVSVAEALVMRWIPLFGTPEVIHTDRGNEFENDLLRELCERFNITKTRTCSYHPSSNGVIERYNSSFAQIVGTLCDDQEEWDMYLPFAQMAYNSTVHDTTRETPNKIVFGEQLRMPIDVMTPTATEKIPKTQSEYVRELEEDMRYCNEQVRLATQRMAKCHKSYYDKRKHEIRYKSEDLVMLKTMVFKPFQRKFQDRYTGPWGVIEPLPGNCYRIQETEDSKPQIVHHDRLKPYRARNVEEHNTDWVKRVKARYAAIRSEPPRMPVPPSTGEDSQQNNSDTEHELLRTVGPYDSDDTDVEESCGVPVDDARETVHSKSDTPSPAKHSEAHDDVIAAGGHDAEPELADVSIQVSFTESDTTSKDAANRSLLSGVTQESNDSDVTSDSESVLSMHSNAEYSVAEFTPRQQARRQQTRDAQRKRSRSQTPAKSRLRAADVQGDAHDKSSSDSIHLAQSQFLFDRESTPPPRSTIYGLRCRPKRRVAFTP